jgi:sulfonate transport system permease protein
MSNLSGIGRWLRPCVIPVLLLLAWQIAASTSARLGYVFVPLQTLAATLHELAARGELAANLRASLLVVLQGLLLGGGLGLALGAAMAGSRPIERLVAPLFNAWRPVPTLGFIPLIALWFGNGELAKLVLVALAAAEPMILNTFEGLRHADRRLIECGQALTFSRWQLFLHIQAPAAVPSIFTGLQHALGFAWIATIGAELLFTIGPGLGGIMERAQMAARVDVVLVSVACIGAVGLAMHTAFSRLGQRLSRWQDRE